MFGTSSWGAHELARSVLPIRLMRVGTRANPTGAWIMPAGAPGDAERARSCTPGREGLPSPIGRAR
jgi:hypothetical protein